MINTLRFNAVTVRLNASHSEVSRSYHSSSSDQALRTAIKPRRITRQTVLQLIVFIWFCALAAFALNYFKGVKVIVHNQSQGTLTNLVLRFQVGRQISITELEPSKTWKSRVNPDGASNVHLEFLDGEGVEHEALVVGYLERNYRGKVDVFIGADYSVSAVEEVYVRF